jgi:DNA-binding CsgD family transcriptional regulator
MAEIRGASRIADLEEVSRWILLVYEAVLDERRWRDLIEAVARGLGGHVGQVTVASLEPRVRAAVVASVGVPAGIAAVWEERHALNPWVRAARGLAVGEVARGSDLVAPADMRGTAYFCDVMAPLGMEDSLGTVLLRTDRSQAHFSIGSRHYFGEEELRRFAIVAQHLRSALSVHDRVLELGLRAAALDDAVDQLAFGLALLDPQGRVLLANRAIADWMRRRDGLCGQGPRLGAAMPNEDRLLGRMISDAARIAAGESLSAPGMLAVTRPSLGRALQVVVAPVRGRRASALLDDQGATPAVLVLAFDPEIGSRSHELVLRRVFGLTPAECLLAAALMRGESLKLHADRSGVTRETVRSQLKAIFEKTGTHRQGELIATLMSCVARVHPPPED